jgi:hypothetical protein
MLLVVGSSGSSVSSAPASVSEKDIAKIGRVQLPGGTKSLIVRDGLFKVFRCKFATVVHHELDKSDRTSASMWT